MSNSFFRQPLVVISARNLLVGERASRITAHGRYVRDMDDEIARVRAEIEQLRKQYELEQKAMKTRIASEKERSEAELARIRESAQKEKQAAQAESNQIREAARQEGLRKGQEEGRRQGLEQASKEVAQELREAIEKVQLARDGFLNRLAASEHKLVRTAITIGERVCRRKIEIDHTVINEVVREVLAEIREKHPVRIRVHTSEVDLLEKFKKNKPELFEDYLVTFVGDDTVSKGGCIAETGVEFIDASIEKKLEAVSDRLLPSSIL